MGQVPGRNKYDKRLWDGTIFVTVNYHYYYHYDFEMCKSVNLNNSAQVWMYETEYMRKVI